MIGSILTWVFTFILYPLVVIAVFLSIIGVIVTIVDEAPRKEGKIRILST